MLARNQVDIGLLLTSLAVLGLVAAVPLARADWHIETVDSAGDVGPNPSIAVDSAGDPHVANKDATNGCVKYAKRVGGTWQSEIVPTPYAGSGIDFPSLALDSQGWPHIVCREYHISGPKMAYAHWDGSQWVTQTTPLPGGLPSLALTSTDQPRIAILNADLVYYASWDGSAWTTTQVGGGTWRPALALDSSDNPRIAYGACWNYCYLVYWEFDGVAWSQELVSDQLDVWNSPARWFWTRRTSPTSSSLCRAASTATYAHRSGSTWSYESVATPGSSPCLALGANDRPFIAYDPLVPGLDCARPIGSSWCIRTIDATGDMGVPSIDVASNGNAHIAYHDGTNQDLKYAWWEPPVVTGDLNCSDDCVADFGDINPFVLYLSNFSAWQAAYPGCDPRNGDINDDGTYPSFGDINPFVALLSGP